MKKISRIKNARCMYEYCEHFSYLYIFCVFYAKKILTTLAHNFINFFFFLSYISLYFLDIIENHIFIPYKPQLPKYCHLHNNMMV